MIVKVRTESPWVFGMVPGSTIEIADDTIITKVLPLRFRSLGEEKELLATCIALTVDRLIIGRWAPRSLVEAGAYRNLNLLRMPFHIRSGLPRMLRLNFETDAPGIGTGMGLEIHAIQIRESCDG